MPSNFHNPQDDEVSKLLDKMYEELVMLRIQYSTARRMNDAHLEDKLTAIENLEDDFNSMLKSHKSYMAFKKSTGQAVGKHSDELLQKIKELSSNIGTIVTTVPKN